MATHENAAPKSEFQDTPARAREPVDRARRLYADARLLEDLCASERGKEIARDMALMALDLMAEARC
jgi:hypothetical protein